MVELDGSRLARLPGHYSKENWEEFSTAFAAGLQANISENGDRFVSVLSQNSAKVPFYQSFRTFLSEAPDILLISLQSAATPPLSFDITQVLACNQSILHQIHTKEAYLQQELHSLSTQLEQYHSYQGTGASVHSILASALQLAASSGERSVCAGLETLQGQLEGNKHQLESLIGAVKEEIQGLYMNSELNAQVYSLQGLIVLYIPSSAYYTYIRKGNHWFKYTDMDVIEVAWAELASCLSHRSSNILLKCAIYAPPLPSQPLTFPIPDSIEAANKRFERELQDYKDTETVLHINELYTARISLISALHHKYREASLTSPQTTVKYEMMNFPYFLKLKADDNLSKWVVLDECLREVDGMGRGLCDFDERNGFILKLKSQLLTSWRDVPRFLFISLHEKLQLERLLETFSTSYRELQLSLYILSHMNQGEYHASLCALQLVLTPLPTDPSNFLKILRDACKVLALRLVSMIYGLEQREKGEWVKCLYLLMHLFIDSNDIHYKQIQVFIETFTSRDSEFIAVLANLRGFCIAQPADLTALLSEIASTDVYSWIDLNPISNQFSEEMRKMKEETLAPWVRLHIKLTTSKQLLPSYELEQMCNLAY